MNVKKPEDLRLGKSERMENGARLQARVLAKLDDHLHAQRILTLMMPIRQPKSLIELASHSSHRSITDHGKRRAYVHAGQKIRIRIPLQIGSLIREPNTYDRIIFEKRRGDRCS